MPHQKFTRVSLIIAAVAALLPTKAFAQGATTGAIAGTVKDASGAVLPGVTVEAASPVLIEKVKTVVTDGAGEYKLLDLRSGAYTVTFSLTGFSTIKREGIDVTTGTTVSANIEMRVGGVEETITVSGAAPVVDVQNTSQHRSVTEADLDTLPTGRHVANLYALIPGTVSSQDVGGTSTIPGFASPAVAVHGSNSSDMPLLFDGMRYNNMYGSGGASGTYLVNPAMVEEISIDMAGGNAENLVSGFVANVIPKQGGNKYSGLLFGNFANSSMQANNIDADLRSRGVTTPSAMQKIGEFNAGFGGPIRKDRIWFYSSTRYAYDDDLPTGAFYAVDPKAYVYQADMSRPAHNISWARGVQLRITGQTTSASKLVLYVDENRRCACAYMLSSAKSYEAAAIGTTPISRLWQAAWRWTITNRLLFDVGETWHPDRLFFQPEDTVTPGTVGIIDSGLGLTYRNDPANSIAYLYNKIHHWNGKATMSYVTGAHALKAGAQWRNGSLISESPWFAAPYYYNFRNGVPQSISEQALPFAAASNLNIDFSLFAQEQWTLNRLTVNLGLRYDYLNMSLPAQGHGQLALVGPANFPEVDNVPNWKDINPRFGVAYDIFGNGKTAVKWSMGRYVEQQAGSFPAVVNPIGPVGNTLATTRSWRDNGDFIPQCDLTNYAANGECGAIDNLNFGTANLNIAYDPSAVTGWGTRFNNWETSASIQHEVVPGLSVEGSYNKRWYGGFRVIENTALTPNSFDSYCVSTPVDSRLPGGGNQQICGFYDVKPAFFGVNKLLITQASQFGNPSLDYSGVDLNATWRVAKGINLRGGTSTGRISADICDVVIGHPEVIAITPFISTSGTASPSLSTLSRTQPFCRMVPPFQTQLKMAGSYSLPWWGLQASGTLQSIQYPQQAVASLPGLTAARSYTSAEIASTMGTLGRPLAGGVTSTSLQILPPGDPFSRAFQLDLRLGETFTYGKLKFNPTADLYNITNNNAPIAVNTTYGANWQRPTTILAGRLFKVGLQVTF
jgi:hypothetical protein